MKNPIAVVVGGPVVRGPVVRGPLVPDPVVPARAVRTPGPPISHLLSPNFFLERCADTHSFCDAIHSEDSNLF